MFEVGKRYEFRVIEDDGEVLSWGIVERYEHPLLKLQDADPLEVNLGYGDNQKTVQMPAKPGKIFNVTSPNFVSAVRKDE